MRLANKVALVTGGTSGIGLQTAKRFQEEGAHIIVTGLDSERLESAQHELGIDALIIKADLTKVSDIQAAIHAIEARYKRLDVIFANAGGGTAAVLESVTEDQVDQQFDLNFKGVFFTLQKASHLLVRGSSVVLTTSFLNQVGSPGLSILSATKAAVRSLAQTLGAELAPRGIRVNAISPGPISTPFHGKLGLSDVDLDAVAACIEAKVPMNRFGEPKEIAEAVVFLASDDSSFMTGSEMVVDGGLTQL